LRLLHLKVIDDGLYTLNCGRIAGRGSTFGIIADVAGKRDHAISGVDFDLAILDDRIAVYLVLYLSRNLGVGASWFPGAPGQNPERQCERQNGIQRLLGPHDRYRS
jgi:hypothetical protein